MESRGSRIDDPMTVTVYSKPACQQCTATKRYLDARGVEYTSVDITEDPTAYEYVASLGYQQAPIVQADERHWSGFRPDLLDEVARA